MSLPKKIVANAEFTYLNPDNPEEGMLFSYEDSDKLAVGAVELSAHELELFENQPEVFAWSSVQLRVCLQILLLRLVPQQ